MITKNPRDNNDPILIRRTIDTKEKGVIWNDAVICTFEALKNWIPIKSRLANTVASELYMNLDELQSETKK